VFISGLAALGSANAAPSAQGSGAAAAQQPAAAAGANSHIYRVSVFRAAPGKVRDLEKLLTSPAPSPGSGTADFAVVFRHREGSEWDFLTVEHMGEQTSIDLRSGPAPQPDSPFSQAVSWHGDTYAAGPSLDEFRRALNLQTGQAGSRAGVYVVADYMAAAGHRGQLQQVLKDIAADTPNRTVTLSHVEGAPWNFLSIVRYDSWQQYAQEEEAATAQGAKDAARDRGLALREHMSLHHDTLATIQAVIGSGSAR